MSSLATSPPVGISDETATRATCAYCHLPLAFSRKAADSTASDATEYCCFGCQMAAKITGAHGETGKANWMLTSLGISIFLSMGVMIFSLSMYSQEVYGESLMTASLEAKAFARLLRYISLVMATPVLLLLGWPILSNAMDRIRSWNASVDLLILLGVGAAYAYSYIATFTDGPTIYFETVCMILVLFTLGRYLEARGRLQASAAVHALGKLLPADVVVTRDGQDVTFPPEDIRRGDLMKIAAGMRVAADGIIEVGEANVDEQILTGESTPVFRCSGDQVSAGCLNLDGALTVRVTASGAQSAVGRLAALLEKAKARKSRYERMADRVATIFVPCVVALAIFAAILGYNRAGLDEALMSALGLLLISCPCALGIATPMAVWISLGQAASRGVLFRDGEILERLASVRAVLFDKTGTLTTGNSKVESLSLGDNDLDEATVLALAAGIAATSAHPHTKAIATFARERGSFPEPITEAKTVWGQGVAAKAGEDVVALGSVAMMGARGASFDSSLLQDMDRIRSDGLAIVCLAVNQRVIGVFALVDDIRADAAIALRELRELGCSLTVLTGDYHVRGKAIAEALAIDTLSELSPEEKALQVQRARETHGVVAMVGDGLNDSPALAVADIGIAMGCGADLTRESANVCLLGDRLDVLASTVRLARATVRTIKTNLFWAFAYNMVGIGLALTGHLSPIVAAAAMVGSSLFVVTNSLKLKRGQIDTRQPSAPSLSTLQPETSTA